MKDAYEFIKHIKAREFSVGVRTPRRNEGSTGAKSKNSPGSPDQEESEL
jgi:hypothetical protein